jgi:hypothetical protein
LITLIQKVVKLGSVEERNKACNENLGGGKEIEAKGTGKGGRQDHGA